MPEYLAPGVYVEEIDTGSKPIEGVSTSTAGMVGVTERGPVGVPMLTTSYGEFERIFGGRLTEEEFGEHRHLPFAVDGFFTNGGKRLFVVRVLDTAGATRAAFTLHDRGAAGGVETALLRAAAEGTGGGGSELFVLDGGSLAGADPTQPFRVGDGSTAEYRFVAAVLPAEDATHVPLHLPFSESHTSGSVIHHINRVAIDFPSAAGATLALDDDTLPGDTDVPLVGDAADIADLAVGELLEIGTGRSAEFRFVTSVDIDPADATRATASLDSPLMLEHAVGDTVTRLNPNPAGAGVDVFGSTLDADARTGDRVVFVATRDDAGTIQFDDPVDLVVVEPGTANVEVRRIGDLAELTLSRGVGERLAAGTVVEGVAMADDVTPRALTRAAAAGSLAITLDIRSGLVEGDVLRIGAGADAEYATIDALPDPAPGGDDPGTVTLASALLGSHDDGDEVFLQTVTASGRPATATLFDAPAGTDRLAITDGTGYVAGDVVRFTTPGGDVLYAVLEENADDLDPRLVEISVPLSRAQTAGAPVAERDALLTVEALDAGAWGNRLRVSAEDEEVGLLARTTLETVVSGRQIRLGTYGGVEAGTILELQDPTSGATVDELLKVVDVNRVNGTITLASDLAAGHLNAIAALPAGSKLRVRSREFRITVRLYRPPDPAVPTRSETVIDTESFRYLSMDPRHSNYVETILGAVDGPLRRSDRRPEGSSRYVRVDDFGAAGGDAVLQSIRLGPETLVDTLPNGRTQAARHPLSGGNDSLGTLTDSTYEGDDAVEPEDRTGLQALRNIDEVSIVAVPGQTSVQVQGALIEHCELMRYRFAVLDGPPPPDDTLTDVQDQRQQFDTRYAALYHPWPMIREPFPARLGDAPLLPIPPAGHVIGVYARTDVERGVHKAPANEVLRGVETLSRLLNKAEHDLLNPSPKNINVIRDFRPDGRGIRIWGARVITSDPDHKYVPVRRLLIFLEKSIERGLQWVVFEPNAEPLWARVRQTITAFLTVVWRNGALEGTKAEQAFFVKCDRTTMTQTDIDNGRLICVIGVAPVKPAEFVIVRIGLKTAEAES
ncbi:MAG TPA: phage tail sheath C-terminal domain-containing protein [Longimicrobiaceae bacterium]|nr:phage tail sheath C-terminal domain-containing protein [Longimicrobiaceae bacterium]